MCPILGTDGGTGIQQVSSVCEVDCLRTMNAIIKKVTDRHKVVVVVQSAFQREGILVVSSTPPSARPLHTHQDPFLIVVFGLKTPRKLYTPSRLTGKKGQKHR